MKVLIATGIYPPEIGGPATYASLLNIELPKREIETDVLPFSQVRKYPRLFRHVLYLIKVLMRAKEADVIFSQDPVSAGLPAVLAGKLLGKKTVLRIAGDYAWEQSTQRYGVKESIDEFQKKHYGYRIEFFRFLQSFSVKHADVVVSPSKYFANLVSAWNKHRRKVIHIYNGIDLSMEFDKDDKYSEPTIITAGRLVPWKGIDILIQSLNNLPGWNLHIAGDGPDKDRLESLVIDLGLEGRVKFLGQIGREQLFENIYRSHIFALLSKFESFSFQIVEAMHIGVPVITLNIGNLSEIVTNEENGILIEPDNEKEAFISAINRLSSDANFRNKLIENGQKRAGDFSINKTVDQMAELFKSLI